MERVDIDGSQDEWPEPEIGREEREPGRSIGGDAHVPADAAGEHGDRFAPAGRRGLPLEQWSVLALVAGLIGALPFSWPVPVLSLMAVAFGLVGVRNCQLERVSRNRWMAVLGLTLGLAVLIVAVLLTSLGRIQFLPFWST